MLITRGSRRTNANNRNRGAALMVAVVIMGILLVFALSLLLVTYTLYASQNKKSASKRNAEAANTLSVALEKELEKQSESQLWRYLRFNICNNATWPYYESGKENHNEAEAFRYFDLNYNYVSTYFNNPDANEQDPLFGLEGFPGSVKLCIYWCLPEEGTYATENAFFGEGSNKTSARMYIEVICETGSQSYVVKNQYSLTEEDFGSGEVKLKNALKNYAEKDEYNPLGLNVDNGINLNKKWTWNFVTRE